MSAPQPKSVLHLEDDKDDQQMLKEVLTSINPDLHIHTAGSGDEGWNLLQHLRSSDRLPHLVIVDLNMPGMDGKQFIKKVKSDDVFTPIPLVIFTTSSSPMDRLFAESVGVKLFTKPLSEPEFFESVKVIVEDLL